MIRSTLLLTSLFFSISIDYVYTQKAGESLSYTLDQCLEIALRQNLDIRLADNEVRTSNEGVRSAFGQFLPSLDASAGYSRLLNAEGGRVINIGGQIIQTPANPPNSYSLGTSVGYTLFNGLSREANYKRSQEQMRSAEFAANHSREQVIATVKQNYFEVLKAEEILKARQDNSTLGRKELERVKAVVSAGRGTPQMVFAQESDVASRELEVLQAENQFLQAKVTLLGSMGVTPNLAAQFDSGGITAQLGIDELTSFRQKIGSIKAALERATTNRNDIASINSSIEASKEGITIAQSGHFPRVFASGGWSWSGNQFDPSTFGSNGRSFFSMNLSVPIFDGFSVSSQVQNSVIALETAELRKIVQEFQIGNEIQAGLFTLESSEKQIEMAQKARSSAEQNFNATNERYKAGVATVTDFLFANSQLLSAKINVITAVYSYRSAQARLEFLTAIR